MSDSHVLLWSTAISTNRDNGRRIIYRYADSFDPSFDRASQPVRIIIVWQYQSESGQPIGEELQRMYKMEDSLESALEKDGLSTMALISTGEGLREWTYYSKSEDEFMARLNFAFADSPRYPIEIHIAHDPNWQVYEEFRSSVKEGRIN